jgi:hypothetical protein
MRKMRGPKRTFVDRKRKQTALIYRTQNGKVSSTSNVQKLTVWPGDSINLVNQYDTDRLTNDATRLLSCSILLPIVLIGFFGLLTFRLFTFNEMKSAA